ncbi:ROK family transcriptional regulator [Pelagibacterium limicola]|uniref:ROK family transcriptional regulator n=1 Tax=Pelagibacterium limicola TaxID=2791022 RepID=UPI0031B62321
MSIARTRPERPRRPTGEFSDLRRGTNQAGGRLYNERLVLSLVRKNGALPKAEIARQTGLSPQTISTIANSLERDGLLVRQTPQKGRVGQPSVPYALAADGALAFGMKIGRRSADLMLVDLLGTVRGKLRTTYPYPNPQEILAFMERGLAALAGTLTLEQRDRIVGIGIALPFELWNWGKQVGAPAEVLEAWRTLDIGQEIESRARMPVYVYNDATAACAAELLLGNPSNYLDFLYIFIGSFIGGGVVLNGSLFPGRSGYAGAIAPLPIRRDDGEYEQVLNYASLFVLAERMQEKGLDPDVLWHERGGWQMIGDLLEGWVEELCDSLALIVMSATAIIDFEAVIIDGGFPDPVRRQIVEKVRRRLETFDRQGLSRVDVIAGELGPDARAMGGACIPLLSQFTLDREVLFKDESSN